MKDKSNTLFKMTNGSRRFVFIIVIILNVALLSGAFLLFGRYMLAYQDSLQEENLGNIANLNSSASQNATSLLSSWNIKLNDISRYITLHRMSYDDALKFISDANSNEYRYFELINSEYSGHIARQRLDGTYAEISYKSSSYKKLQNIIDDVDDNKYNDICFAPEFTDSGPKAEKFFAMYKHILLTAKNGESEIYTLFLAAPSKTVLAEFNNQIDFKGQSTVLIDSDGNYIVSNDNFKSSNFFQYIYKYNDLTLDQKNEIKLEMEKNGKGELYYKNANSVVEDCVFRYEKMETNSWYCITCVPLSSYRTPVFNTTEIVLAVIMLISILVIDVLWLQITNKKLRISMAREMEASAAKGNFMSRMSHEIRTPLNAVIGYNTLARNELSDAKKDEDRKQAEMKVMDCLTKSSIASKHLLTIINDVLDMSAIESGKIKVANERFDFKGLVSSLTTLFYSQAKNKGVDFDVVFNSLTEEWFVGDQMRTNQILTNLLSNAVKFTPDGGTVKLTISQPEAEVNAAHIHFEVADTGIGMTEEYLQHIWMPFEQADSSISRRFGGTGLGLSITKNLVELMNGSISVESQPGSGTTFKVDLTFERTEQPEKSDVYDFSGIKALIVDDDEFTCKYAADMFTRCGARSSYVLSGKDAVELYEKAENDGEPFTVCLVDWRMPGMNGIDTSKKLKELSGEGVPIIVITAYDFTEIADDASEAGIKTFLSKPIFQSTIFDLLANISGKQPKKSIKKNDSFDLSGIHILLAEDNAMNMEIAKRILESAGCEVDCAWNGREAVSLFESSENGTYSVILMDVHMPVMDGHNATRAIRKSAHSEAGTIPIIAMTADAFAENVAEALSSGMNDHISKPIDINKLFETISKYIV